MRVTKNKWPREIRFQNICRRAAEDFGFGSFQRHKVTFGISVVTHSSAGKRLGYMLLWKCTSCMIILYSRLNGVHPILYLVNMSHLICVCVCVSQLCITHVSLAWEHVWPSECGLNIVCPCLHLSHMDAGYASGYVKVYPSLPLTHTSGFCLRGALIAGNTSGFCVMHQTAENLTWQREAQRK